MANTLGPSLAWDCASITNTLNHHSHLITPRNHILIFVANIRRVVFQPLHTLISGSFPLNTTEQHKHGVSLHRSVWPQILLPKWVEQLGKMGRPWCDSCCGILALLHMRVSIHYSTCLRSFTNRTTAALANDDEERPVANLSMAQAGHRGFPALQLSTIPTTRTSRTTKLLHHNMVSRATTKEDTTVRTRDTLVDSRMMSKCSHRKMCTAIVVTMEVMRHHQVLHQTRRIEMLGGEGGRCY